MSSLWTADEFVAAVADLVAAEDFAACLSPSHLCYDLYAAVVVAAVERSEEIVASSRPEP